MDYEDRASLLLHHVYPPHLRQLRRRHTYPAGKTGTRPADHECDRAINWGWLATQDTASETQWLRHVRLRKPLLIKVDGRTSRGVITYED